MVKKLTIKTWIRTSIILLVSLAIAIPLLWWYGPSALLALSGRANLATQPLVYAFIMSAGGLVSLALGLLVFIAHLTDPVSKRVNHYLAEHPEVTMEQLDQAFDLARNVGSMWISERWTFSHELWDIVVENADLVRVYSWKNFRTGSARQYDFYLCMEFAEERTIKIRIRYKDDLIRTIELYRQYTQVPAENNL